MDIKPGTPSAKTHLRQKLLAARQNLSADQRLDLDGLICTHIMQNASGRGSLLIAGYLAANGEPDIRPALAGLHAQGHLICLPVLAAQVAGEMQFHRWTPTTVLESNRFDIDEPTGTAGVQEDQIDLVLMPLLGFSAGGQRLGMGGGYYDRLFSATADQDSPRLCGIAYSNQRTDLGTPDSWDVPMHSVITEYGLFTFND